MSWNGSALCRAWRRTKRVSQGALAASVVPSVTQAAVSRWEDETDQRPEITTAMQLDGITDGFVPAESWGYSAEELERVRAAFARRDAPPAKPGVKRSRASAVQPAAGSVPRRRTA